MKTKDVADLLDREFRIPETADAEMTRHAISEVSRGIVSSAFHKKETGLMFDFAENVDAIYCTTFLTDETIAFVLSKSAGESLIFTHHPFDYHEDHRGLTALPDTTIEQLQTNKIAVYAIHAPLDVGLNICVSRSLAERLSLTNPQPFYPALGGYLGVYGRLEDNTISDVARHVGAALGLETVDMFDNSSEIGLTAVVAGGGDQIDILQQAIQLGCTSYVTGTAVHRWQRLAEANREFREYARKAKINLIGGTHYNTEKCAVQDVAAFLTQHGFMAEFIEDPILSKYMDGNFGIT
ncbi:MAG: Nif3-like dinuclear metal center hexameric protein [Sedimentisphaerales bacterium]|nr:Nif3-like dinuclear metal center hexameric protein [Sedimentisphaerales bacterium]